MEEKFKYYLGQLEEINGEITYYHTFRCALPVTVGIDEHIDNVARTWYSCPDKLEPDEDGFFMFNGGCLAVKECDYLEITKEVYDAIVLVTDLSVTDVVEKLEEQLTHFKG